MSFDSGTHEVAAGPPPAPAYPVRLDGRLDASLSRGLWLIKWLAALPHVIILAFLWIAVFFVSVIAFFAILFTGRYPRGLFDFTVGVLRWSWRVDYYAFGVLGTDRYPPFSLAEHEDYPARFAVDYPEHLSRGLVLVKWWLLAIPQYVIVGVFLGGATYAASNGAHGHEQTYARGTGLISILVVCAAVALLFMARDPDGLYRFLMGLHRWVFRVAAYGLLLRDEYPPFRLDDGGDDPGTAVAPPPSPQDQAASW
jgi:hypothetical protein